MLYNLLDMAKPQLKVRAQELRKSGQSIKEIAKELQVSVGSVSVWCRDIQLSLPQIKELEKRAHDPYYGRRLEYANLRKKQLREKIDQLQQIGANRVENMSKRELFLVGTALYWAEGFKKDTQVGFSNSDPKMITLFLYWLIHCHEIDISLIKIRIVINDSHKERINDIEKYWLDVTKLPKSAFQKPTFQKIEWKKTYSNKNTYFGVARIRVGRSTDLLRTILGSISRLGEYKS